MKQLFSSVRQNGVFLLTLYLSAMVSVALLLFCPNVIKTNLYPIIASVLFCMSIVILVCESFRTKVNVWYVLLGALPFGAYILILWLMQSSVIGAEWFLVGLFFFVLETYIWVSVRKTINDKEEIYIILNTISYYLLSFVRYACL